MLYFTTGGREVSFLKVRGAVRRILGSTTHLEISRRGGDGEAEMVGGCRDNNQHDIRQAVEDGAFTRRGKRAVQNLHQGTRPDSSLHQKIQKVITNYPCCPMIGIVNSDAWLNDDDLMYIRKDNKIVNNVLDAWAQKTCRWSIFDFNTFYSRDDCKPTFWAGYRAFEDVYYTIDESIHIVDKLLEAQFHDNVQVKDFLHALFNVVERKVPKLGTILVHSPPNAGKNFFFEIVLDYYWNRGQLGNLNRHNQFGLQEAVGKRILLWDEPNYEPGMVETLKNVTAGHPFSARVKCQADCAVYSTPLIILTNRVISIMHGAAFETRIKQYRWSAQPFLEQYTKKPNPLCFYPLMLKWGIIMPNPMDMIINDVLDSVDDSLFE